MTIDVTPYTFTLPGQRTDGGKGPITLVGNDALQHGAEFMYAQGDSLIQWAPTTGTTTESVNRTRCEGRTPPFLLSSADVHCNDGTITVKQVNHAKRVVVAQAHVQDGNDPSVKLFWINGAVWVGIRVDNSKAEPGTVQVLGNVLPNMPFTRTITITKDGLVTVSATCQGRTGKISAQLAPERAARAHVFHFGPYNQVDQGLPGELPGEGTLVQTDALDISHVTNVVLPVVPPAGPTEDSVNGELDDLLLDYTLAPAADTKAKAQALLVARQRLVVISSEIKTLADADARTRLNQRAQDVLAQLGKK